MEAKGVVSKNPVIVPKEAVSHALIFIDASKGFWPIASKESKII